MSSQLFRAYCRLNHTLRALVRSLHVTVSRAVLARVTWPFFFRAYISLKSMRLILLRQLFPETASRALHFLATSARSQVDPLPLLLAVAAQRLAITWRTS